MAPGRGLRVPNLSLVPRKSRKSCTRNGGQNVHERFEIIFQTYMYWKFVFTQTYCTNCWAMFIIVWFTYVCFAIENADEN